MTVKLDHILLGVADLDAGSAAFAAATGVTPATGGSHPGFGTRNRLAAIGPDSFFEVIAPDPTQPLASSPRAQAIAALTAPALLTFAIQTTDLDGLIARAEAAGLGIGARVPMSRTRPDGVRLAWTVIRFSHPAYGEAIPFAIDWQGSPHPSTTSPGGCTLRSLTVLHPDPTGLAAIYRAIGLDVAVSGALQPGFVVVMDTPNGEVSFLGNGARLG
jgi:hypothetical protein